LVTVTVAAVAKFFSLEPLLQSFEVSLRDMTITSVTLVSFETMTAIIVTTALTAFMVIAIAPSVRKGEGYQMQK